MQKCLHDYRLQFCCSAYQLIKTGKSQHLFKIYRNFINYFQFSTWNCLAFMVFLSLVVSRDFLRHTIKYQRIWKRTHLVWTPITAAVHHARRSDAGFWFFSVVYSFLFVSISPSLARSFSKLLCYCRSFFIRLSSFLPVSGQQFFFGCFQSVYFYRWAFLEWPKRWRKRRKNFSLSLSLSLARMRIQQRRRQWATATAEWVAATNGKRLLFVVTTWNVRFVYISQFHILTDMSECAGPRNSTHTHSLRHTRIITMK